MDGDVGMGGLAPHADPSGATQVHELLQKWGAGREFTLHDLRAELPHLSEGSISGKLNSLVHRSELSIVRDVRGVNNQPRYVYAVTEGISTPKVRRTPRRGPVREGAQRPGSGKRIAFPAGEPQAAPALPESPTPVVLVTPIPEPKPLSELISDLLNVAAEIERRVGDPLATCSDAQIAEEMLRRARSRR